MRFLFLYLWIALLLHPHCTLQISNNSTIHFHVGVILDLASKDSPLGLIGFDYLNAAYNDFYAQHDDYKTRLALHFRDSNDSVIDAASAALNLLQDVRVDAIIGPQKSTQVNFVMDLGDRSHVPIISFSATSPSLIPRTPFFVRTAQSDANQVRPIASIVKAFQWSQVVIIYEDTEYGYGIVPYLCNALQDVDARVSYRSAIPKSATDDFMGEELNKMMSMQTRVFVVHMSQSLAIKLFLKVRELGMMSEGYVWIVTSGLTDLFNLVDDNVCDSIQGVLGVKPVVPKSQQLESFSAERIQNYRNDSQLLRPADPSIFGLWAYDTLWALALAAEKVGTSVSDTSKNKAPLSGTFDFNISKTGPKVLEALLDTKFKGLAGEFHLVNGQLAQTPYQILNFVGRHQRQVGIWTESHGLSKDAKHSDIASSYSTSKKNLKIIIWPGDTTIPPRGWEFPVYGKKLRIGVPRKPGFNEFLKVETDPNTNHTTVSGYYKDVFEALMEALTYAVPFEYRPYDFFSPDGTRIGCYDDLVYEVSTQDNYDAALGDITITANRSGYADFTLPFAEGGITCLVPVTFDDQNHVITFLEPLTRQLWIAYLFLYLFTAGAIWFLGVRARARSPETIAGQHAGMTCYFPFFPGETIEANLLCLVIVTWAFVAFLVSSTYTASLSSKLTVAKLKPVFTDVTQLIKNGDYVGCQEGSFLVDFLVKLGFDKSNIKTYKMGSDCDEALSLGSKNGGISAYYDVMPHIRLLLSEYCGKYKMVGPIYRTDGFGIAFPRGSPVVADISRAIITLTEHGTIQEIDHSIDSECSAPDGNSYPTSVTLRSFLVLFVITGSVTVICLLVSQFLHLHRVKSFNERFAEFEAKNVALWNRVKQKIHPSSSPANNNTQTMQNDQGTSSDVIEMSQSRSSDRRSTSIE